MSHWSVRGAGEAIDNAVFATRDNDRISLYIRQVLHLLTMSIIEPQRNELDLIIGKVLAFGEQMNRGPVRTENSNKFGILEADWMIH
jgi:hypothetical protein